MNLIESALVVVGAFVGLTVGLLHGYFWFLERSELSEIGEPRALRRSATPSPQALGLAVAGAGL